MTRRRDRERHPGCEEKEGFSSSVSAHLARLRAMRSFVPRYKHRHHLSVYRCRQCGRWHLGNESGKGEPYDREELRRSDRIEQTTAEG